MFIDHAALSRNPRSAVANGLGIARQRIWQSMRILRRFCVTDLVVTAEVNAAGCRKYVSWLRHAGYIKQLPAAAKPLGVNAGPRYLIVRDSGPAAPIRRGRDSAMVDGNTGTAWGRDGKAINPVLPKKPRARARNKAVPTPASKGEAHE